MTLKELESLELSGLGKKERKQIYNARTNKRKQSKKQPTESKRSEVMDRMSDRISDEMSEISERVSEMDFADDETELTIDDIENIVDKKIKRTLKKGTSRNTGDSFFSWNNLKGFFFPVLSTLPIIYRSYRNIQAESQNITAKQSQENTQELEF